MEKLKVYKIKDNAYLPEYGSQWAACFDLRACLQYEDVISVYDSRNQKVPRLVDKDNSFTVFSQERALVPTGLIFDLDETQSLRIHPRSGLSLKNGLVLANCEGVVDADYVDPTFVMMYNMSDRPFVVQDGMRIAQGEIVKNNPVEIVETLNQPEAKTDRNGGFGSTGVE